MTAFNSPPGFTLPPLWKMWHDTDLVTANPQEVSVALTMFTPGATVPIGVSSGGGTTPTPPLNGQIWPRSV